mmetsp:Transcript_106871/g.312425  ORF Transcript_106871/g.312425 Transcript_106871/m.312425 type:complete len:266 (+) Transcript_106871:947-1744(+)
MAYARLLRLWLAAGAHLAFHFRPSDAAGKGVPCPGLLSASCLQVEAGWMLKSKVADESLEHAVHQKFLAKLASEDHHHHHHPAAGRRRGGLRGRGRGARGGVLLRGRRLVPALGHPHDRLPQERQEHVLPSRAEPHALAPGGPRAAATGRAAEPRPRGAQLPLAHCAELQLLGHVHHLRPGRWEAQWSQCQEHGDDVPLRQPLRRALPHRRPLLEEGAADVPGRGGGRGVWLEGEVEHVPLPALQTTHARQGSLGLCRPLWGLRL